MRKLFLILITALTLSSFAQANELACESSHLSTPAPNLEQIASNLARLRLQIYQMPTTGEKSRANEEFKTKYAEFESIVGNKHHAENLFREQIRTAKQSNPIDATKESERKEKEQKEREKEATDPINTAQKMIFHEIPEGKFMMGDERKVPVEITKPFSMMATTVTQMMWAHIEALLGETDQFTLNPSYFNKGEESISIILNGTLIELKPDHPVERVTWFEATDWVRGLNKLSKSNKPKIQALLKKLIPDHKKGDVYNLPTEAQWEYVMRNLGHANENFFDQNGYVDVPDYAWFSENAGSQTHAVATRKPRMINGSPFFDLEGNVRHWVQDAYAQKLPGGQDPLVLPAGTDPTFVIRGGNFGSFIENLSSGTRSQWASKTRASSIGFRLVRYRP